METMQSKSTAFKGKNRTFPQTMIRLAVTLFSIVFAFGETLASSGDYDFVRIPFLESTPVIDGAVDLRDSPNHEWGTAAALTGFSRIDNGQAASIRQLVRIGYTREGLYLAFTLRGMEPSEIIAVATARDSRELFKDQGIEFIFGLGKSPRKLFHFVINADGLVLDFVHRDGSIDWESQTKWDVATRRLADGWEGEALIPWAALEIDAPKAGATMRFNVMHNHAISGLPREHSTWASLFTGGQTPNRFQNWEAMGKLLLGHEGEISAGVELRNQDQFALRFSNPFRNFQTVRYRLDGAEASSLQLSPSRTATTTKAMDFDPVGLGSRNIEVLDADEEVIYRHTIHYRSRIGSSLRIARHFPMDYVEVLVQAEVPPGSAADIQVKSPEGEIIDSRKLDFAEGGTPAMRIPVDAWEKQKPYTIAVRLADPDGEKLAARDFVVKRPATPAWMNTTVGLSDAPVAPFTPIEVEDDSLSALIKEYHFAGRSLPARILSQGREILAGPLRLEATIQGKKVDLSTNPIRITAESPTRVEWKTDPLEIAQGLSVDFSGWMEEDGFVWVEARFHGDAEVEIDSLELLLPVRREIAKFFNGGLPLSTFIIEGEPEGDQVGQLGDQGHAFHAFCQNISLHDYEGGLSVITDNPEGWRPENLATSQSVSVEDDVAILRFSIIGKPTVLPKNFPRERKIEFGLMAMPAKPVDRKWRNLRSVYFIRPHQAVYSAGLGGAARITYPAEQVLARSGKLEFWVKPDFNFSEPYPHVENRVQQWASQVLMRLEGPGGEHLATLRWNGSNGKLEFQISNGPVLRGDLPADWGDANGWGHIGLSWQDGTIQLHAGGRRLAEASDAAWPPAASAGDDLSLALGKDRMQRRAEFRVAAIRAQAGGDASANFDLTGKFPPTDATTLVHDFRTERPGTDLPPPVKGPLPAVHDLAQIVDFDGISALAFGEIPDLNHVEWAQSMGIRTLNYHEEWPGAYGAPYPLDELAAANLEFLVDICRQHDISLMPYFGFGLNSGIPEAQTYGEHWRLEPLRTGGPPGFKSYTVMSKSEDSTYTDFMLHNMNETVDRFGIRALYYDHVQTPYPSANPHLNEGFLDEQGNLQPRSDVRAVREYLKRLYTMMRSKGDDTFIESHGSGFTSPVRAAWVDRMWIGEIFRLPHIPFDFETYALSQRGEPAGMPSAFLYWRNLERDRGVTFEHMLSFTLPFDIEPKINGLTEGAYHDQLATMRRLWAVKDAFDTAGAEWHPFYRNERFVSTSAENSLASLHLHSRERALLTLANVGESPHSTSVRIDLDAMGLPHATKALDAYTGEKVSIEAGVISSEMPAYGHKLILLKPSLRAGDKPALPASTKTSNKRK